MRDMKSYRIRCIAAFVTLASCSVHLNAESPGDCFPDENPQFRCGYMRVLEDFPMPHGPGDPQVETPWTDVLHSKIDIEVIPAAATVAGTVTITAKSLIANLTTFVVYLDPVGGAQSVTAVGGAAVSHTHVGDKVTLTLNQPYNVDDQFTVSISSAGSPDDGIYWGSHDPGTGPVPIVATLSEPYSARGWWPGKDVLNDKGTFDIWLTVPAGYVAASNGLLQGIDPLSGGRNRYRWAEINPMIAYLASIAIADYVQYDLVYNHLGDTMPMNFYMLPEYNTPAAQAQCATFVQQCVTMSDLFGQYPFVNEKCGMAHTPTLGGTYMEHQTLPSMPNFNSTLINAHELGHHWWGDDITCETWGDIWLNEGMASFSEALWQEFKPGGSFAAYKTRMDQRHPSNTDSRVYVLNVNSINSIFSGNTSYNKGAWVAHMLRHVIGDADFFQGLRDYRAAHSGSSATTAEFTAAMSASVGFDINWFINQWVMNSGSPDYSWSWRTATLDGKDHVYIDINQTQATRGFPLMTMPVDIRVTTAGGDTTYVVWVQNATNAFAISLPSPALDVALDPDAWILTHSVSTMAPPVTLPPCQGDVNGDGLYDGRDIQPFVNAAIGTTSGPSVWRRSDMNFNGRTDAADVEPFVSVLLGRTVCP